MADYAPTVWVDDDGSGTVGTPFTAARMNKMEAAIDDAAEHNEKGLYVNLPAADAAHKNHLFKDQYNRLWYCDGSTWEKVGVGNTGIDNVVDFTHPSMGPGLLQTGVSDAFDKPSSSPWVAMKFTNTTGATIYVSGVAARLKASAPMTAGNVVASIVADSFGVPGGILDSSIFHPRCTGLSTASSGSIKKFGMNQGAVIGNGVAFWVMFRLSTDAAGGVGGLMRNQAVTGAATWNGTTWTTQAYGYYVQLYYTDSNSGQRSAIRAVQGYSWDNLNIGSVAAVSEGGTALSAVSESGPGVSASSEDQAGVKASSQRYRGVDATASGAEPAVRGQTSGVGNAVHGFATSSGAGVHGQSQGSGPAVRGRRNSSLAPADLLRAEDENGTALFNVNKDGLVNVAAKGSNRHGFFYDSGEILTNPASVQIGWFTGLHMLTAGFEYELQIHGRIDPGGAVVRTVYAQPNFLASGGAAGTSRWNRMRGYSTAGGATATDASGSAGTDPNGAAIGFTDWNTVCEVHINARFSTRGWDYYFGYQSDYNNMDIGVDSRNMLSGRVDGWWFPPSTPISEISDIRIGLTGGTFNGWCRLRGWQN